MRVLGNANDNKWFLLFHYLLVHSLKRKKENEGRKHNNVFEQLVSQNT
jgi:hypothetical protein